jgi:RimJ/RimL family protein N-acetyltransferase
VIQLETDRLIIRNWEERDREVFHEVNSDEHVMEYFEFRRSRPEADAIMDQWRSGITDTGYGFTALELKSTGECLGICGVGFVVMTQVFPEGTVEIGWRIAARHWGKGYATESAQALLAEGFAIRGLHEIIAFAVPANTRSTNVMRGIGMTHDPKADFDHPRVTDAVPHLKRHVTYRITKEEWESLAH